MDTLARASPGVPREFPLKVRRFLPRRSVSDCVALRPPPPLALWSSLFPAVG
jgi:hypothetical protein